MEKQLWSHLMTVTGSATNGVHLHWMPISGICLLCKRPGNWPFDMSFQSKMRCKTMLQMRPDHPRLQGVHANKLIQHVGERVRKVRRIKNKERMLHRKWEGQEVWHLRTEQKEDKWYQQLVENSSGALFFFLHFFLSLMFVRVWKGQVIFIIQSVVFSKMIAFFLKIHYQYKQSERKVLDRIYLITQGWVAIAY